MEPLIRDGFLLPLNVVHPPPRYGIREHVAGPAGGIPWAGYSEVLGRCITHALLDRACWLAHVAPGHMPSGRFTVAGGGRSDALASFAGHMCLRFWDDGHGMPTGSQPHAPPAFGAHRSPACLSQDSHADARCARPSSSVAAQRAGSLSCVGCSRPTRSGAVCRVRDRPVPMHQVPGHGPSSRCGLARSMRVALHSSNPCPLANHRPSGPTHPRG